MWRDDGSRVDCSVAEVTTYAERDFPTARTSGGEGRATLRVITCGGAIVADTGRYRSGTVVFADVVPDAAPG